MRNWSVSSAGFSRISSPLMTTVSAVSTAASASRHSVCPRVDRHLPPMTKSGGSSPSWSTRRLYTSRAYSTSASVWVYECVKDLACPYLVSTSLHGVLERRFANKLALGQVLLERRRHNLRLQPLPSRTVSTQRSRARKVSTHNSCKNIFATWTRTSQHHPLTR